MLFDLGPSGACLRSDVVRLHGPEEVRAAIRTSVLHVPWPGVVVDATRAAAPLTVVSAASLAMGRDALVTGPSGAFLHGLTALPATPVHLVVPYDSRQRKRAGIVVHKGGGLTADREERQGLPVVCLERLISDLACTARPPDALAVVDQALAALKEADRPVFRRRIRERIEDRADPRGTRIGRRLVDLATGLAESPAESWWLWRVVDLGFPVPEVNPWIRDLDGTGLFRLDMGWMELRIALEHNGYAAHRGRERYDASRLADLKRRDWLVVVAESDDMHGVSRVDAELYEAFRRRGVDLSGRVAGSLRPLPHRRPRP